MKLRQMLLLIALALPAGWGFSASIGTADPNPLFYGSGTSSTSLTVKAPSASLGFAAEIHIHDFSGRRVISFQRQTYDVTDFTVSWDARNEAGRLVKSGVYIVTVIRRYQDGSLGEESERFRIGLVRQN